MVVGTDNRSGRGASANGVDMIPNDCGALVRLQGPKRPFVPSWLCFWTVTVPTWIILAITLGVMVLG